MKVALIGNGAITRYVMDRQAQNGFEVTALLVRAEKIGQANLQTVSRVDDLPQDVTCVVDCAGHSALQLYGVDVLRSGRSLITVSIGALADDALWNNLEQAAHDGGSTLHLATGAIGGLDALSAARAGQLKSVTYIGRKPPLGWTGSRAEDVLDLSAIGTDPQVHFEGSARDAALSYPKNANVAAAVALAGLGLDQTQVHLIADPTIATNIHEVHAMGDFGTLSFRIEGQTLPSNPRTSALAAMSVVAKLSQLARPIRF